MGLLCRVQTKLVNVADAICYKLIAHMLKYKTMQSDLRFIFLKNTRKKLNEYVRKRVHFFYVQKIKVLQLQLIDTVFLSGSNKMTFNVGIYNSICSIEG